MSDRPICILHFMIPLLVFGTEIIGCFLFQKKRFFSIFLGFSKFSEKNAFLNIILPMHCWVQTTIFISWIFFQCHEKHFETFFVFGHLLKNQECPKMKNPGLLFLEVFFRELLYNNYWLHIYFTCSINKCPNALENTSIL